MCVYVHIYTHVCVYIHMYVCIYIYIYVLLHYIICYYAILSYIIGKGRQAIGGVQSCPPYGKQEEYMLSICICLMITITMHVYYKVCSQYMTSASLQQASGKQ